MRERLWDAGDLSGHDWSTAGSRDVRVRWPKVSGQISAGPKYADVALRGTQYDRIFIPGVRAEVEHAVPADLFSRDQGVMLGGGIVWFNENGMAISINQP